MTIIETMTTTTTTMMTTSSQLRRAVCSGTLALVGVFSLGFAQILCPQPATAQHAASSVRTVTGTVQDKSGKPLDNAVVYIKDTKTLSIKSYLTNNNGAFHFNQLSMGTDYDLWAEMNGKSSKIKTIGMFNSKSTLDFTLKLEQ